MQLGFKYLGVPAGVGVFGCLGFGGASIDNS
jgi:hypothetical protein